MRCEAYQRIGDVGTTSGGLNRDGDGLAGDGCGRKGGWKKKKVEVPVWRGEGPNVKDLPARTRQAAVGNFAEPLAGKCTVAGGRDEGFPLGRPPIPGTSQSWITEIMPRGL